MKDLLQAFNLPTNRPPTSPGEMLLEEFIKPHGLTQQAVADKLSISYQRLNGIIRGRRAVSVSTAARLARLFGTSADFWLGLQRASDLYRTILEEGDELRRIESLAA